MTRNDLIYKWTVYTLTLLPIWFLEAAVLRRLPVFGVIAVLLPQAAVAVAVMEGPIAGAGFGLAVGVLCDAAYYGTGGGMTLAVPLLGAGVGLVTQYALRQNFLGFFLCAAGSLTLLDLFRVLWRLLRGVAGLAPLLEVAVAEVLWSLLFSPLVYLLVRSAYRRVGGTSLL